MAELLHESGAEVIGPANDGAQALQLWQRCRPDAAVLDFQMPELTGLEVVQAIRAHERSRPGPAPCLLVILSVHAEASIVDECLAQGADLFLNKARDLGRLSGVVAAIVGPCA